MSIDKLANILGITREQMLEVLAMALDYRVKSQKGDEWMSGASMGVCVTLATLSGLPVHEFMQAAFDIEVLAYKQAKKENPDA